MSILAAIAACGDNAPTTTDAPRADAPRADAPVATDASGDARVDADVGADAGPADADATAPTVVATTPADGTDDVALDAAIVVVFSEPIDPATVTATALVVQQGTTPVPGTIAVTGTDARFTPDAALAIDAPYTVTATTAVADLAGNHLAADHVVGFTSRHRRHVFMTSVYGSGDLGAWPDAGGAVGVAAGDAICRARAAAAGLRGTYVAWLSSATDDAYCRVQGLAGRRADNCGLATLPAAAGPWLRVDDQPWAGSLADLVATPPAVYTPELLDETGAHAPYEAIYSNTAADGTALAASCSDWSSSTGGVGYGGARMTGTYWTEWGTAWGCAWTARLLCFEIGDGPAAVFPTPAATAKRAFITSTTVTGNLGSSPDASGEVGVAAGDAICRARAAAAGLANPTAYKAWLAGTGVTAASRFSSDGPWVRLDGMPIASSKADLLDGLLATTVNLTETGTYLTDALAWTGTLIDGGLAFYDCGGWAGADPWALAGHANDARKWTNGRYISPCTTTQEHLYCFED